MWFPNRRIWLLTSLLALAVLVGPPGHAQSSLSVVPGAQGFGTDTRAAYGCGTNPAILRVTNLNDSGAGSLREALLTTGPRVVIFEVSGTITLASDIAITEPCLTVAGQTAPSPGITLRNNGLAFFSHDVLVQHLRIRPGDGGPVLVSTAAHDAMFGYLSNAYNIVLDHNSFSWAGGKNTQLYRVASPANVTFWRNIISEALYRPVNVTDNWAGGQVSSLAMHLAPTPGSDGRISVIGNLFAHNSDRNPEAGQVTLHFINNVVYDWGKDENNYQWATFFYNAGDPNVWSADVVGNKYIGGPPPSPFTPLVAVGTWDGAAGSKLYLNDNAIDSSRQAVTAYMNNMSFDPRVSTPPVSLNGITVRPSGTIEPFVLANAGARPADRDAVDVRIVSEVTNRTGSVISSQNQVGGWPTLTVNTRPLTVPTSPHSVRPSGYTALEEWLQGYASNVEGGASQTSSAPAAPTGVRVLN